MHDGSALTHIYTHTLFQFLTHTLSDTGTHISIHTHTLSYTHSTYTLYLSLANTLILTHTAAGEGAYLSVNTAGACRRIQNTDRQCPAAKSRVSSLKAVGLHAQENHCIYTPDSIRTASAIPVYILLNLQFSTPIRVHFTQAGKMSNW